VDRSTLQSIFDTVWVVAQVSFAIAVVEGLAMWRLAPWVFRVGYPILRRSVSGSTTRPARLPHQPMDIADAKVRWLGASECVFRRRVEPFKFEMQTPFPLKCTLRWQGTQAVITGRLPIGPLGFIAAWLVGWTAGAVMAITNRAVLIGCGFLLLGWGAALGMITLSFLLERRRANAMAEEVLSFHARAAA
jgi:hypothetical protein